MSETIKVLCYESKVLSNGDTELDFYHIVCESKNIYHQSHISIIARIVENPIDVILLNTRLIASFFAFCLFAANYGLTLGLHTGLHRPPKTSQKQQKKQLLFIVTA